MSSTVSTPRYRAVMPANQRTMYISINLDENTTDAVPGREPTRRSSSRDANGAVNFFEAADNDQQGLWKKKLGRYLYDHVVKRDMLQQGIRLSIPPDKIILEHYPLHYTLWVHKKGDPHIPRKDYYLHGSRFVHQFRSPLEFTLHLKWILDGQPMKENGQPDCRCRYCDETHTQSEIAKGLGFNPPSKRDGDRRGRSGKGGGSKSKSISTSIPYKDYTKLNPATRSTSS